MFESPKPQFIRGTPVKGKDLPAQMHALGSPRYLYHATPVENLLPIRRDGLHLKSRSRRAALYGKYPSRIYFAINDSQMVEKLQLDDAQTPAIGAKTYAVLTIDPALLSPDVRLFHDPEDRNSVYTETGFVPPAAIVAERIVEPNLQHQYYAVALAALKQVGLQKLSTGDDFSVDSDAILIYVGEPISPAQLDEANQIIRSHRFSDLVEQNPYDLEAGDPAELVGYLGD